MIDQLQNALKQAKMIRVRAEEGEIPDREMIDLMSDFIDLLIAALMEAAMENQQLQSELENYQDVAFHKGRLQ